MGGGSPCTFWSIAQSKNRETKAEGLGWELFLNYLIAKEKFKPDYFLYENNVSASKEIKEQIKREFKVDESDARYIEINSALVSAQNRKRFYVHNFGEVEQPQDRGILLKDILETGQGFGTTKDGKSLCLMARYSGTVPQHTISKAMSSMVAEPVACKEVGRKPKDDTEQAWVQRIESSGEEKSYCLTTAQKDSMVAEPIVQEQVKVGALPRPNGELSKSQAMQVYSTEGKSTTLMANGGGMGGKTGLYAEPVGIERVGGLYGQASRWGIYNPDGKAPTLCASAGMGGGHTPMVAEEPKSYLTEDNVEHLMRPFGSKGKIVSEETDKTPTLLAAAGQGGGNGVYLAKAELDTDTNVGRNIYEVKDGKITIKGKQYPIKLKDGYYIIRKLTVTECARLQTMPDNYCRAVSNSQAYKALGNGWTAEVIKHIVRNKLKDIPKDEKIIVLSMYDGIGTGRYVLDSLGFTNVEYHAYEIDKYPVQVAMSNYPDIIQHGDAFQVREDGWRLR